MQHFVTRLKSSDNTYKETLDPEEAPKYEDNGSDETIDVDVNEETGDAKEDPKHNSNESLLGDLA